MCSENGFLTDDGGWFMYLIRARMRVVQGTLVVAIIWYTLVVTWNASIILDTAPLG